MSVMSDIRRALRPAGLAKWEEDGLAKAVSAVLRQAPANREPIYIDVPSVTASGSAYLLRLLVAGGGILRFTVDLDPDRGSPAFLAYFEGRERWLREKAEREEADRAR